MITNIYTYPELKRQESDDGRFYLDSKNNPVPSVTTVLNKTSNKKDSIQQWRNRVGEEEANRIIKQSTDIGTMVHEALELYLNEQEWRNFSDNQDGILAERMTEKFIESGLNSITEVWGLEVGLILDGLYAGTADCVGKINGVPSLIDFKTARKMKKREWIEDYFLQCCAYANAHNVMFNTDINQIVILMIDRDLIFKEFIVKPTEFNILTKLWKKRLIEFQHIAEDLKNSYRKKLINKTVNVLFENKMKSGNRYFGRDEYFNPVIVESKINLTGMIKNVKILKGTQNLSLIHI